MRLTAAMTGIAASFVVPAREGRAGDVPSRIAVAPILIHRFEAPRDAVGFGTSVGAGDFNGDGVPDLVIGGNPTFVYSGADQTLLRTIVDPASGFGIELEVVGDVQGDGTPDLLIASTGQAKLYSGFDGSPLFDSYVYDTGNDAGTSMAALGDVDGDGFGDFVIGELNFFGDSPRASIWSGNSGGQLVGIGAGHSVAALGDVNGDSVPDFAAGRYGAIHVVSGAGEIEATTLFTVPGYDASLGAADVNGDGIKDLLLMMPQATPNGANGSVRAFCGINGEALGSAAVPALNSPIGCFFRGLVCGIGDIDGDGHEEFAASVVCGYGGNYGPGSVCVFSGATLDRIVHLTGSSPGAALGYSLVGPGDVDGDGTPDLLIGAPGVPNHPNRPLGAAFLYRLVHDVVGAGNPLSQQVRLMPNPVRRGRPITLELAPDGNGSGGDVTVFDVRGRVIRKLESLPGGRTTWDGRAERGDLVPSGVYCIRVGPGSTSHKLVVLD